MTLREAKEKRAREMYGNRPGRAERMRIYLIMGMFWLFLGGIVVRLYFVHLNPAPELSRENDYHVGSVSLPIPRGQIHDRNAVLLATDNRLPTVWADPSLIENPGHVAGVLSARLGIPEEELLRELAPRHKDGSKRQFAVLAPWVTGVPAEELELITAELGRGVALRYDPMRYYPQGELAAHLLGYVNRAGDPLGGLEIKCDQWLRSVAGSRRARKDARRNLLESLTLEYTPPRGGHHVYLTIDAAIQRKLEQSIDAALEFAEAPRGMGMLLDPVTGAVLAMAYRPAFDPNHYEGFAPELRNPRALTDVFEPGSAFKIVTAAAALELGFVTPDTLIDCEGGSFNPYGHRITDVHKMGVVTFTECYAESSNVAHIKLAALLGPERLEEWIRRFGFGETATRELGGMESRGIFRPRNRWSRLSMGALPIGQEIGVTLPQLARAFAVLANGGFLIEPHFVDRVEDRAGNLLYQTRPAPPRRILSEHTAATMCELSHQVVLHGTGRRANIPEYRVGGKTGTAQRSPDGKRGYAAREYTSIFAGFAPVGNPRVVAVIVIEEPRYGYHYGGMVCGPIFKEVVHEALALLGVPEDPVRDPASAPAVMVADADTMTPPTPEAAGEPAEPFLLSPLDDLELIARERDGTEWVRGLPDFTGMTMREARERVVELGITWDPQGSGRVVQQRPEPGTPVTKVDICRLYFASQPSDFPHHDESTAL